MTTNVDVRAKEGSRVTECMQYFPYNFWFSSVIVSIFLEQQGESNYRPFVSLIKSVFIQSFINHSCERMDQQLITGVFVN